MMQLFFPSLLSKRRKRKCGECVGLKRKGREGGREEGRKERSCGDGTLSHSCCMGEEERRRRRKRRPASSVGKKAA